MATHSVVLSRVVRSCATLVGTALFILGLAPPASADSTRDQQWYLSALGVTKAWSATRGDPVKVCVIDSGIDSSVPDLKGSVVGGKDFSGEGNSNGTKPVGAGAAHGTGVASVLAGRGTGSSSGVIGTAPAAQLLSASVDAGADKTGVQLAAAVRWCTAQHAGVINISLGGVDSKPLTAAVRSAMAANVVVVAASGDVELGTGQPGLPTPADVPGVVAVSGIDRDGKIDPGATVGKGVSIAGPFSTDRTNAKSSTPTRGVPVALPAGLGAPYKSAAGTSLSAPIVAGIVALIRAEHPELNAANVINRLVKTATPAGGSTPNNTYGYGIVNADKAVTANVPMVSTNPLGGPAQSSPPASGSSSSPSSSSAPSSASSAPSSAAPSSSVSSSAPGASSSGSSGLGAGAWIGIAAVVAIALALVGWLISRSRRPAVGGPPPPGYGPPPR